MNVIWILIAFTLLLVLSFVAAYVWAAHDGQFDDLTTPAHRMLLGDEPADAKFENTKINNNLMCGKDPSS